MSSQIYLTDYNGQQHAYKLIEKMFKCSEP